MSQSEDDDISKQDNNCDSDEETETEDGNNKEVVKAFQGSSSEDTHASGTVTENQKPVASKATKKSEKAPKPKVKIKTLTIDGQLVYFCKICDKIFTRRKDKLNHELAHSGESVLTCPECGKEYLHKSSLASHMWTHSAEQLHLCELCPKMFAQAHHLKTHTLSHSEPTYYSCKTCWYAFPTTAELNHHIRSEIKEEMSQHWCRMCKVYLCRSHGLQADERLHAHHCSACDDLFLTHKKLRIHMKKYSHHSIQKEETVKPLEEYELYNRNKKSSLQKDKENIKKKNIVNEIILRNKRLAEDNLEDEAPSKKFKLSPRPCLEADNSSTSMQESAPEIKEEFNADAKSPVRSRKGKPYCKKCNKSFKDIQDLDRHKVLMHEYNQNAKVALDFSSKESLEQHHDKHSRDRPYVCPVCGKDFQQMLHLSKHSRCHNGDFPYKCSTCKKAFKHKIQLHQHKRLHVAHKNKTSENSSTNLTPREASQDAVTQTNEDDASFKCHICHRSFSFRYKLANHLRLHTNVKCFQCYICHKTFATKHYLQRHLQTHVKKGMEVDVKNIIVDEDSKKEIDVQVKNPLENELSSFEDKKFTGKQCSVIKKEDDFIFKFQNENSDSKIVSNKNISMGENSVDSLNTNIITNIKSEVIEDNSSEHSFCSILTRDSDKSDLLRCSSDASTSFKMTMAKERRKLRKRWKKLHIAMKANRLMLHNEKSSCLSIKEETEGQDLVIKDENLENDKNEDKEKTTIDMTVQINGVCSEEDNVMTIYVDVYEKPKIPINNIKKLESKPLKVSKKTVGSQTCDVRIKEDVELSKSLVLDIDLDDGELDVLNCLQGALMSADKPRPVSATTSSAFSKPLERKFDNVKSGEPLSLCNSRDAHINADAARPTMMTSDNFHPEAVKLKANVHDQKPMNFSSTSRAESNTRESDLKSPIYVPCHKPRQISVSSDNTQMRSSFSTTSISTNKSPMKSSSSIWKKILSDQVKSQPADQTEISKQRELWLSNTSQSYTIAKSTHCNVTTASKHTKKVSSFLPSQNISHTGSASSDLSGHASSSMTPHFSSSHTSHASSHTSHASSHTSHVSSHTSHASSHTSHASSHTSHASSHTSHTSQISLSSVGKVQCSSTKESQGYNISVKSGSIVSHYSSQHPPTAPPVSQPLLPSVPSVSKSHSLHSHTSASFSSLPPTSIITPKSQLEHYSKSAFQTSDFASSHSSSLPQPTSAMPTDNASTRSFNPISTHTIRSNDSFPGMLPSSLIPSSGVLAACVKTEPLPARQTPAPAIDTDNPLLRNMNMMDLVSQSGSSGINTTGPSNWIRCSSGSLRPNPPEPLRDPQSTLIQANLSLMNMSSQNLSSMAIRDVSLPIAPNIQHLPGTISHGPSFNPLFNQMQGFSGDALMNVRNVTNIMPDNSLSFFNGAPGLYHVHQVPGPSLPYLNSSFPFVQSGNASLTPSLSFGGLMGPTMETVHFHSINPSMLGNPALNMGPAALGGLPFISAPGSQLLPASSFRPNLPSAMSSNLITDQFGFPGTINPTLFPTNMPGFPYL